MPIKLDIGILKNSDVKLKEFENELNRILNSLQQELNDAKSEIAALKSLNPNYIPYVEEAISKLRTELREEMLKLQIVYPDNRAVQFPAGGPIEADLVELLTAEVMSKGVAFKTAAHVENDIREGIKAAIYKFKENILKVPVKLHS